MESDEMTQQPQIDAKLHRENELPRRLYRISPQNKDNFRLATSQACVKKKQALSPKSGLCCF